jgi:hypothetical protein
LVLDKYIKRDHIRALCYVVYEIITPTNAPKIYIILFLKISYMFGPCWAETCRRFLRIRSYIFFGALVGIIISYVKGGLNSTEYALTARLYDVFRRLRHLDT